MKYHGKNKRLIYEKVLLKMSELTNEISKNNVIE